MYNIHAFQKALQMHPTFSKNKKSNKCKQNCSVHNLHKISFGALWGGFTKLCSLQQHELWYCMYMYAIVGFDWTTKTW